MHLFIVKMKVIVGGAESGKTTILLHYVYNELSKLIEHSDETNKDDKKASGENDLTDTLGSYDACFITSKKRMIESNMIFGIYCEVSIETLKQIKLKYIEDYEGLV